MWCVSHLTQSLACLMFNVWGVSHPTQSLACLMCGVSHYTPEPSLFKVWCLCGTVILGLCLWPPANPCSSPITSSPVVWSHHLSSLVWECLVGSLLCICSHLAPGQGCCVCDSSWGQGGGCQLCCGSGRWVSVTFASFGVWELGSMLFFFSLKFSICHYPSLQTPDLGVAALTPMSRCVSASGL